jgi:peptidoglycan hydrolase-like protein with peptidoglycan-binding domain
VAVAGGETEAQAIAHTAALQSTLALAGYWSGPIDGQWSDALTAALEDLQSDLGVPATGVVDATTLAAAEKAIAEAKAPTSSTTAADGTTTTTG